MERALNAAARSDVQGFDAETFIIEVRKSAIAQLRRHRLVTATEALTDVRGLYAVMAQQTCHLICLAETAMSERR
jgi:hypothetical protein